MMVKPMAAPTAIAAGRLRPARDFFGFFAGGALHRTLGRDVCAGISVCHGRRLLSGR